MSILDLLVKGAGFKPANGEITITLDIRPLSRQVVNQGIRVNYPSAALPLGYPFIQNNSKFKT